MTAAQFVLWGWKPSYCPAGQPIKLTGGSERECGAARRQREQEEGWLLGIYPEGAEPDGLRDQVPAVACEDPAYPDYEQAAESARQSGRQGVIFEHRQCGSWHIRFESETAAAITAGPWQDTEEQTGRLDDLERRILAGDSSDTELTEYRALTAAHEAWLYLQPFFWAWIDEQETRTGICLAPAGVPRPEGC